MASMSSQPPAQRRSSQSRHHPSAPQSQSGQEPPTLSSAPSTVSEDSHVVVLDPPSHPGASTTQDSVPPPLRRQDTDVKKCWICFADETEDTPETSVWRSPCPCALVAHEDCLLDWIADMESPATRKRSLTSPKILCPQCKSEIHLARPWNPVVEAVKAVQRVSARVTTPAMILAGSSSIYYAFTVHGVHTIFAIFGQADGWRILRPFLLPSGSHDILHLNDAIADFKQHWRLRLGLPLITPMLILSRTTLADSILPVLPILFLATQGDARESIDMTRWPPSASLTVSLLPYIRGMYNAYYARIWAPHERRWLKEIQPRLGQSDGQGNGDGEQDGGVGGGEDDRDDDNHGVLEIRGVWEFDGDQDEDEDEAQDEGEDAGPNLPQQPDVQQQNNPADGEPVNMRGGQVEHEQQAHPLHEPPLPDNPLDHVDVPRHPAVPVQPQAQQRQPVQQQNNNERLLSVSTTGLAEKFLGALFFPTIASLSGEFLRLVLPASWTTPPSWSLLARAKETGILQRRWGRSIFGGCLFVVLKDAVMLYVRWKMAQQHRSRRVLNYDRKKKRVVN